MKRFFTLSLAVVLGWPAAIAAQDPTAPEAIPDVLAQDVLAWFNDPSVLRLEGRATIPAGVTVESPIAFLRGEMEVSGTIRGDVVLLDAGLIMAEGGRIEGDVLIVGGRLREGDESAITGTLTEYAERFRWADEGGELVLLGPTIREERGIRLFGSRISVRAGSNYNRVEGLPILFGPVIESSGENPLYFEGLATFRTETGFTDDELGFRIRLERRLGRPTRIYGGVSAYSEVTPIERWGLGDLEASMATFILHRDYRDYYERHGWSVYAGLNLSSFPLSARITYADEKHFTLPVGSPWSLRRNEEPWRPLPLAAEGDLRLLDLDFRIDERNDSRDPSDGWFLRGRLTYGLTGDLELSENSAEIASDSVNPARSVSNSFSTGFLDLRRYARVDPNSHLSLRTVFAGSLTGRPLPNQFQHALGGEGSLPGWSPLSVDCGARSESAFVATDPESEPTEVFLRYGCDRVVLFQAEFRRTLSRPIGLGGPDGWFPRVDLEPTWILFFDVGRGWSDAEEGIDFDDRADIGAGFEVGSLGAYFAYPLGGDRRVNFFVRLQRRF